MSPSNSQPYRLMFVAPNLGGGGAERALVNIINYLDRSRFQPHLALFQKTGVFLKELAPDVPVYEVQPTDYGLPQRNWVRVWAIKRLCDWLQPALVMSVTWQVNFIAALTGSLFQLNCPLVTNEQVALSRHLKTAWQRHIFWPVARRVYRRITKIVTISEGIAAELQHGLALPHDKFQIIYNPVAVAEIRQRADQAVGMVSLPHPLLVAVGRLDPQKNFPLLFGAIKRVVQEQPVTLYVLGEGSARPHLESLIRSLGLQSCVHLLGFQCNPYAYVKQADLFVLSSDYEGFANVIVEAMAVGTPVVATDCPYGPRDILAGGQYGILVPPGDEEALAQAILAYLKNPGQRSQMEPIVQRRAEVFSVEEIVPQYERLFSELLAPQVN